MGKGDSSSRSYSFCDWPGSLTLHACSVCVQPVLCCWFPLWVVLGNKLSQPYVRSSGWFGLNLALGNTVDCVLLLRERGERDVVLNVSRRLGRGPPAQPGWAARSVI